MKCEILKDKLKAKDIEVDSRNKNTVEIFELIKDDVLEFFIDAAISREFKEYGDLLRKEHVLKIIARLKNVDIGHPTCFSILDYDTWSINPSREVWNGNDTVKRIRLEDVFGDVDYEKLKTMLYDHLLKNGFKNKWTTNVLGQKVKTDFFVTTRKDLERVCCSNDTKEAVEKNEQWGAAVIILAVIALSLIYLFVF